MLGNNINNRSTSVEFVSMGEVSFVLVKYIASEFVHFIVHGDSSRASSFACAVQLSISKAMIMIYEVLVYIIVLILQHSIASRLPPWCRIYTSKML